LGLGGGKRTVQPDVHETEEARELAKVKIAGTGPRCGKPTSPVCVKVKEVLKKRSQITKRGHKFASPGGRKRR